MLKKTLALALACVMALSLAACGAQPSGPAAASGAADTSGAAQQAGTFPYTFTDSTGRSITLQQRPQKVAVLLSSHVEVWQLAGGTVSVTVGEAVKRGFAGEDTPLVDDGAGLKIDAEHLVACEPDFVIASADLSAQAEVCERLNGMGIPSAAFREESFEDYLTMLKIFTDITGDDGAWQEYGVQVQARVDKALAGAQQAAQGRQPLKVLFIRAGSGDSATRAKTAKDHFVGVMLAQLGTQNIADAAGALSEGLSLESVLMNQPDVILITTQGSEEAAIAYMNSVLAQSGWKDLDVVKNGQCHYLPRDLFHYKPNARWDEAYRYLTQLLYPEGENA